MFHVKLFFLLFFFATSAGVSIAQGSIELEDKPFSIRITRDDELDNWLQSNGVYQDLNKADKDMIYWVNAMRKNPKEFYEKYVAEFVRQFPESGGSNASSLKRDLEKAGRLQLMKPSSVLQKEALSHASDVAGNMKRLSHNSSTGKSFQQRMKESGITECAGENIYEGKQDALRAVILLLIDQGVAGMGHRKALLEPQFNLIGTASVPRGKNFIIVQDFSCE